MATKPITQSERDQLIADEFGVNADYVGELLQQFERDPSSVDDQWRSLFDELLRNGRVVTDATPPAPVDRTSPNDGSALSSGVTQAAYDWSTKAATPSPGAVPPIQQSAAPEPGVERIPIRGPALRIAENMEASLAVPTATSQRQVPLKLLDENRRLINQHVAAS
ncbi:MAG TPA: multifunctional oxoglutarate decarboxylase/oxoglutarate dehydrogenase thiamine pyrophosphate-binding subunit/dihydrolipoyllysine-residue succinyltransferase subunit, partial [Blastocatellia bacterium]|nr:multifunctional oxoglutarate decarboxylase/oxoglutarate dehydrogenase thiamine pyrophosphate-binding subunit/dihydrolipoyllysine-residue succinyltransferase subunit [Blastocatellia bacterium]